MDDDNAWALGGAAGHAGLFSTAVDVARLGQAWLVALEGRGRSSTPSWPASSRGGTRRPGASARWAGTRRAPQGPRSGRGSGADLSARSATSASPAARSGSTATPALVCVLLTNHVHPGGSDRRRSGLRRPSTTRWRGRLR